MFVIRWVARSIILAPFLGIIAVWLYSNYVIFTDAKRQDAWVITGLLLDILALAILIFTVVQLSWLIGNFFRWLWNVAEFPRLPRRPTRNRGY